MRAAMMLAFGSCVFCKHRGVDGVLVASVQVRSTGLLTSNLLRPKDRRVVCLYRFERAEFDCFAAG